MAVLVTAIHALSFGVCEVVDARNKCGHDGKKGHFQILARPLRCPDPYPFASETAIMDKAILKYMHLAGDVWIYLNNHAIRKATGAEIARIIDFDPEFALHFATQNAAEPPMFRARVIPLQGLEQPN